MVENRWSSLKYRTAWGQVEVFILIIDSLLYPTVHFPYQFYLSPEVFFFFSGQAAAIVYSEAVMAIAVQADRTLRVTEPLFLLIKWP